MADTTTTNYSLTKPEIDGSTDTWGPKIHDDLDIIDSAMQANADVAAAAQASADAALPLAGGVMSGRVDLFSAQQKLVALGNISGATELDLAVAQIFTATVIGATVFSAANVPSGTFAQCVVIQLTNGGSAAITWPGAVHWVGGAAPSFTAAGTDVVVLVSFDEGTTWLGVVLKNFA